MYSQLIRDIPNGLIEALVELHLSKPQLQFAAYLNHVHGVIALNGIVYRVFDVDFADSARIRICLSLSNAAVARRIHHA